MSIYVLDTNSFHVMGNYYPEVFPSFWEQLTGLVAQERVGSVREVKKELEFQNTIEHLRVWCDGNSALFPPPSEDEMEAVAEILSVKHFSQLIGEKQRLRGLPVADPFIVAHARVAGACVVTEEAFKPNAAKIPNVCKHFGVNCIDVQTLLKSEGWRF